jgi:hypothetical protein
METAWARLFPRGRVCFGGSEGWGLVGLSASATGAASSKSVGRFRGGCRERAAGALSSVTLRHGTAGLNMSSGIGLPRTYETTGLAM